MYFCSDETALHELIYLPLLLRHRANTQAESLSLSFAIEASIYPVGS